MTEKREKKVEQPGGIAVLEALTKYKHEDPSGAGSDLLSQNGCLWFKPNPTKAVKGQNNSVLIISARVDVAGDVDHGKRVSQRLPYTGTTQGKGKFAGQPNILRIGALLAAAGHSDAEIAKWAAKNGKLKGDAFAKAVDEMIKDGFAANTKDDLYEMDDGARRWSTSFSSFIRDYEAKKSDRWPHSDDCLADLGKKDKPKKSKKASADEGDDEEEIEEIEETEVEEEEEAEEEEEEEEEEEAEEEEAEEEEEEEEAPAKKSKAKTKKKVAEEEEEDPEFGDVLGEEEEEEEEEEPAPRKKTKTKNKK